MQHDDGASKLRALRLLKILVLLLMLGAIYFAFWRVTGIGIPCIFNSLTGAYCPGCGISRMFANLLRFDFNAAANNNVFVLCLLPFAVIVAIFKAIRYIKNGVTSDPLWLNVIYVIILIASIAFWILRNIPAFTYLAPH